MMLLYHMVFFFTSRVGGYPAISISYPCVRLLEYRYSKKNRKKTCAACKQVFLFQTASSLNISIKLIIKRRQDIQIIRIPNSTDILPPIPAPMAKNRITPK